MVESLTFEQLPNEIFRELFEYFDLKELYKTFSNLNCRISSLLAQGTHAQVILYKPEDIEFRIYQNLLPNVKTLVIGHTKAFYDSSKSNLFSNIRRLVLCQPTREQFNSITPSNFPNLERLHLINSRFVYGTEELCQRIFSNQFPYLNSCSLPRISHDINNQWTRSIGLQSLTINIWDIRVYIQILDTCPNLLHLKMELNGGYDQDKTIVINSNKTHSSLRHMILTVSSPVTCDFIDAILSYVSCLEYFSFNAKYQRSSILSISRLASIVGIRIPRLIRIKMNITLVEKVNCKDLMAVENSLFDSCKIKHQTENLTQLAIVGSLRKLKIL